MPKTPERAAFGVYPQLKGKRSKQDREAAKNFPVDLARGALAGALGIPGDIESLARLPYELYTGNDSPTILPTSEDILKRIPFGSDTPASQFAAGIGTLAGGSANLGALPRAVKATPGALKAAARNLSTPSTLNPQAGVIKMKGGNWMGRNVEGALSPLTVKGMINNRRIPYGPEFEAAARQRIEDLRAAASEPGYNGGAERVAEHLEQSLLDPARENQAALNKWIQSNLTNYVKKEMATPEDPVRRLAEEGITHFPIAQDPTYWARKGESSRKEAGGSQMAMSDLAKQWENRSDAAINAETAQMHQDMMHLAPGMYTSAEDWIKKLPPETTLYNTRGANFNPSDLGFDHILDVLRQDLNAGRIRPEQLSKVSMDQAVRRTYEFDQEMAKRMRETALKQQEGFPVYKEYPEGYRWIELKKPEDLPEGYSLDEMGNVVDEKGHLTNHPGEKRLEEALKYEGDTMGHCVGGYCPDVLEGKSRIYSLRDAKGEPHVTIEAAPPREPGWAEAKQAGGDPRAIQDEAMRRMGLDPNSADENREIVKNWDGDTRHAKQQEMNRHFADIYREQFGEPPARIIQIKGKQNRAPKEDYLPFVQDFVRSGQWSDVGDFGNTGLIRKSDLIDRFSPDELDSIGAGEYLTKGEHDDLLLKALNARSPGLTDELGLTTPPTEGMAHGGRVHFSDNPDVMQLELAGGGLVKGFKAAAKGMQNILPAAEREANKAKFLESSKVPQRLYHGTTATEGGKGQEAIRRIKPSKEGALGSGVYLTPSPAHASGYSGIPNDEALAAMAGDPYAKRMADQFMADRASGTLREGQEGGNMLPVHAQMRNPLILEGKGDPMIEALVKLGMDEESASKMVERAYEQKGYIGKQVQQRAQAAGYDGLLQYRDGDLSEVVSYNPNAVKSAIGNQGTYDINDPDLNKAAGGAINMQAGGIAKAIKAAKAAKEAPMKASEALGRIEGRPLVITQADRTKVGGGFLGGPGFSGLQLEDPAYRAAEAAWAVKNPGTAKMILGGRGESKDAVYAAMLGTPTQHQSNQMVFDKLLGDFKKAAKKGGLDPELRDRINMRLANSVDKDGNNIFPPDVDILSKNFKDLASTFDRRSVTANLIGGMGVGGKKGQIIDYDKIIRQTTDPMLLESPTGALGNRLFTLSGGIIERPDLHPAFPTIMQGEDLGVSFDPVARNLIMKDFTEKTMREKGRAPGIFDYTRGYPPSQLITEDLLTELQKMGKKAGGEVKAPAAQIDGNQFVVAAQKYGLGDDMATLNKMVSLVNQGATVDEAARVLSGGVRKAAGGEITADDLILEERKL